ncbi:MAG: ribonuclease P protein component [candidate division WS1 bacterium]|jgi:ribonuclease P protein component|nr:ribonuclease P protein component [candidate division WS1 bacterium]
MPTLRRQGDLDRIFQNGRWHRFRSVSVGTYMRDDCEPSRFAFIAGGRIGNAVRRNRSRRRMREALRSMLDEVKPGADVVVLARDATADVQFESIRGAIRSSLVSEGLIEEPAADEQRPATSDSQ